MRKLVFILTVLVFTLSLGVVQAFADGGKAFSYFYQFQWLRDADGDGIPNCLDDDWERPQNGDGYGKTNGSCLLTGGSPYASDDDAKMTRTRKENRHNDGNPNGLHDRDRDRDRLNQ